MAGPLAGLGPSPASHYLGSMRSTPHPSCPAEPSLTTTNTVIPKKPFEIPYEGNDSTRTARQAIDQDIGDMELKIRSLRRARNQLASISVLPPEVLSKIFIFIRDSSLDPYMHRQCSTHWICSVGHICHHWREVALNCATLWSAPIFTNPELVQEMMRRSKKAALTIQLTTGSWTPRILNEIENAMTQIFRIRVLRLSCGSHSDRLHNLFAAFSQAAPHLEQLTLANSVYTVHSSHYLLPDNAFADAPRLQSIELDRFNFSWASAIFKHNLTNLKVKTSRAQDTSTFTQLLEALGHMPNLQTLCLNQCIPSHATVNGNEPTLDFPALRSLEIESRVADCTQFLRCIKYPPHTLIQLSCTSLTKVNDYTDIFASVGESLHTTSAPSTSRVFRSANLTLDSDRTLSIYLYSRPDSIMREGYYFIGPQDDFDVSLRFICHEIPELSFGNVLRELHRLIDLKPLEAIELDWFPSNRGIESIRETIGKLPKLKFFRVGPLGTQAFQAIQHGSDPVSTNERGRGRTRRQKQQFKPPPVTVFPALKTLCLRNMDLNAIRSPGALNALVNTLIHRSNMNAPIEELQLDDCRGVRIEQKRLLGGLVVDLLVDGEYIDVLELDSEDEDDMYDEEDFGEDGDDMYDDDDYFGEHDMYGYDFDLDDAFGWFPF